MMVVNDVSLFWPYYLMIDSAVTFAVLPSGPYDIIVTEIEVNGEFASFMGTLLKSGRCRFYGRSGFVVSFCPSVSDSFLFSRGSFNRPR